MLIGTEPREQSFQIISCSCFCWSEVDDVSVLGGIFEEQAKEVRKEYYRRERAINFMKKEERKKKIEAALDRKKAKKEKIAKKEALMKKGAKRGK